MVQAVEITDLSYTYPDGNSALHSINLTISQGESIGIIGRNGAGKSTLLLHLNGVLYSDNAVKILGMPLIKKNFKLIREKVGLVFQDPDDQLFMPTVFDDIAFGPINKGLDGDEVKTLVFDTLKMVGMNGYEERVTHHLSYGEKKRIAIATALSLKSEILVLDEPSSNLDPESRKELIKLLRELNVTKIIASHDLEMILELCNRSVLIDKGEIITVEETRKILQNETLLLKHGLEMPLTLKYKL